MRNETDEQPPNVSLPDFRFTPQPEGIPEQVKSFLLSDDNALLVVTAQKAYQMGYQAIETAVAAVDGKPLDKMTVVPVQALDRNEREPLKTLRLKSKTSLRSVRAWKKYAFSRPEHLSPLFPELIHRPVIPPQFDIEAEVDLGLPFSRHRASGRTPV